MGIGAVVAGGGTGVAGTGAVAVAGGVGVEVVAGIVAARAVGWWAQLHVALAVVGGVEAGGEGVGGDGVGLGGRVVGGVVGFVVVGWGPVVVAHFLFCFCFLPFFLLKGVGWIWRRLLFLLCGDMKSRG